MGVIALQWHTRVKFMTMVPLLYTMGLMAIDEGAFSRLSTEDQAIFRTVMRSIYQDLDRKSAADDDAALNALIGSGIKPVEAVPEDVIAWRQASQKANEELAQRGVISKDLLSELQAHLKQYRRN